MGRTGVARGGVVGMVAVAVVVAMAMLAAACGGGGGSPAGAAAPVNRPDHPLERLLADLSTKLPSERSRIQGVDDCLTRAGFKSDLAAELAELRLSGEEVLTGDPAQVGYGISTPYDSPGERMLEQAGLFPRSRLRYWESLPPEEQGRYLDTLIGSGTEPGCLGQLAESSDAGGSTDPDVAELVRLNEAWAGTLSNLEADPTVAGARAEWSRCLAERGYDYQTPGEIPTELERRLALVVQSFTGSSNPPAAAQPRPADIPPEAFVTPNPELEALQAYETALAVASTECGVRPNRDVAPAEELVTTRQRQLILDREEELIPLVESAGLDLADYVDSAK